MPKGRLEAFSDGVLAIIITIMVLELHAPHGDGIEALLPVMPQLLSYVLSFIYVAIYWSNHHHLLLAASHVSGSVLWANLHLLFWLSLFPFATAWMGQNHFAATPSALYGFVLMMAAIAYFVLERIIIRSEGTNSALARALGNDWKGKLSVVAYAAGIGASYAVHWLAQAFYAAVALAWLVPDRRIERTVDAKRP